MAGSARRRAEPAPPELVRLERWVRAAVAGEATRAPADADAVLARLPHLRPADSLAIYRDQWFARLRDLLRSDFPAVAAATGAAPFDALARAYLAGHPPGHYNIARVGEAWPAFLAARPGLRRREFLADLARLEWAVTAAFDHPDVRVLDPETLRGIPPERLAGARFPRAATATVLEFRWPVNAFLEAVRRGETPRAPRPAATAVLVSRRDCRVHRSDLTPALGAALQALFAGRTLADAMQAFAETAGPEAAARAPEVSRAFADWAAGGAFEAVVLPRATSRRLPSGPSRRPRRGPSSRP